MIESFIKIRIKQFYRGLLGVGLIRIIFLIVLFSFIGFELVIATSKDREAFYVLGITALIILMIQIKRPDKHFLKTNFNHYKLILFAEYLILVSPVLAMLIVHLQWIPTVILLATLSMIIHFNIKTQQHNLNTRLQQWIPAECFEWKGGIRQTFFFLIPVWILGFSTSFFIGSVPIVLFIIGIIPIGFYDKGEPYQMIVSSERRTTQFLFHKAKMQFILFSIVALPLIAVFMVFHYELWYIPIIEYFIFVTLHIYLILLKYAFYEPNTKPVAAQLFGSIGVLCGFVPLFLPLVWLLSVRFFFKSKENLNLYLNDYN
jgi:hypothetical protein